MGIRTTKAQAILLSLSVFLSSSIAAYALSPSEAQDLMVTIHNAKQQLHQAIENGDITKEDMKEQMKAAYESGRITFPEIQSEQLKSLEAQFDNGEISEDELRKQVRQAVKNGEVPRSEMRAFMKKAVLSGKITPKKDFHGKGKHRRWQNHNPQQEGPAFGESI